jgi:hypothetical protein
LASAVGCSRSAPTGTSDPAAKLRLERILEFYRSFLDEKKQPPADEKALQDFIRALPPDRKQGFGMTDNLDELFTSPRDHQKYAVRYKLRFRPGGDAEAVAWEATGEGGSRYVALTIGYVELYDEAAFAELKKK